MAEIRVKCPRCETEHELDNQEELTDETCSSCGHAMRVPAWMKFITDRSGDVTPHYYQAARSLPPTETRTRPTGSANITCPHCLHKGDVKVSPVAQKRGVSGAKATGAILTGGVSILITGLSRKETVSQATCSNCSVTWEM